MEGDTPPIPEDPLFAGRYFSELEDRLTQRSRSH